MGILNAPQEPTSRRMLPPAEHDKTKRYRQAVCCAGYVTMSGVMSPFAKLLWPLLFIIYLFIIYLYIFLLPFTVISLMYIYLIFTIQ